MQNSVKIDRDKFLGGSDIPAIMNMSPFRRRWEVLQEKAGLEVPEFLGNAYTAYGNAIEGKIRDYVNETYGYHFIESKFEIHGKNLGERGHLDGEDAERDTVLEVKSTSDIFHTVDEYPHYLSQLLYYMMRKKREYGVLAVYERPEDMSLEFDPMRLQVWFIKLSDYSDFIENIKSSITTFKRDCTRLRKNPSLTEESFLPKKVVQAGRALLALERKLDELKALETEEKKRKAQLLSLMEEYGVKSWKTPRGYTLSYCQGSVSQKFDSKKFKDDYPDLYPQYVKPSNVSAHIKVTAPKEKSDE